MITYQQDINNCVSMLSSGGTILYPTDTVWGIGCDATNETAVLDIFNIKNRPATKSMVVLLAEAKDILTYVAAPHPDVIDIVRSFQTPTTVVFENALGFAPSVLAGDGSIGIRVTRDGFCKSIIKRLGNPLVSTSANVSGGATSSLFKEIDEHIIRSVGYVCTHRREELEKAAPSRVVKILENGTLQVLRH